MEAILFLWNISENSFPLYLDIHLRGVVWGCKPWSLFSRCSFSFSLSEEVLLELLEAMWAFKTTSLLDVSGEEVTGFFSTEILEALWASKATSLLDEVMFGEEVTGSFFTSSSIFCKQTSKAVWSLDVRLACLVVGSLTKGFSRVGTGLLGLPD